MHRLCLKCFKTPNEGTSSYYIKGFRVNYSTDSSETMSSGSNFMKMVLGETSKQTEQKTTRVIYEHIPKVDKLPSYTNGKTSKLSPNKVQERCRISYECRNNMLCIEGKRLNNKK